MTIIEKLLNSLKVGGIYVIDVLKGIGLSIFDGKDSLR